ncbi:MAG: DnaJ C-terminal domain-containing protein [bacterium]
MTVKYQDYYEILGLPRSAAQDEIRKSYRKLARRYHPDVNKSRDAEEKFKQIAEAYEVLGEPEHRKKYDSLGKNWRMGQEFSPPPRNARSGTHYEFSESDAGQFDTAGGFSDFFEAIFSGLGRQTPFQHGETAGRRTRRGADHETELTISLEEAYQGATKAVSLQTTEEDGQGKLHRGLKDYNIRIPRGVTEGSRIRLTGQGGSGDGSSQAGDLYFRIHIAPHPTFRIQDRNLEVTLPVTPWEAALGDKVPLATLEGQAALTIPPGTQGGQRIRLRGKGMPARGTMAPGDLFATVQISIPTSLTAREKELFQSLADQSTFNPRQ